MPDKPLVSVITASCKHSSCMERTLGSILSQDYQHFELIVVDCGSTDGTTDILRRVQAYDKRLRYVTERDIGLSSAIRKGLELANGSIIGWLNAEDQYAPGAMTRAVRTFQENSGTGMVFGKADYVDGNGKLSSSFGVKPANRQLLFERCFICHSAAFYRREAIESVGGINDQYHYAMHYDLWMRISKTYPIKFIDRVLAFPYWRGRTASADRWVNVGLPEVLQASRLNYGTISNFYASEYMAYHLQDGPAALMRAMKTYGLFGEWSKVAQRHPISDGTIPSIQEWVIHCGTESGVNMLILEGNIQISGNDSVTDSWAGSLYANGELCSDLKLPDGKVVLEIPMEAFKPRRGKIRIKLVSQTGSSLGEYSALFQEPIPLSRMETKLYKRLKQDPGSVSEWLFAVRHIKIE